MGKDINKQIVVVGVGGGGSLALASLTLVAKKHNVDVIMVDSNNLDFSKQVKEYELPELTLKNTIYEMESLPILKEDRFYNVNPRSKKRKQSKPR